MFESLKELFTQAPAVDQTTGLRLAGAVLMLEVASADFDRSEAELKVLKRHLAEHFGLEDDRVRKLLKEAERIHEDTTSLHTHLHLINQNFDADSKAELCRSLWAVAYADGGLHHYEEAVIRRLADLLHVPHRVFIRTKHEAARGR